MTQYAGHWMNAETEALRNPKCRVNSGKLIDRTQCKHNCKEWDHKNKKCKQGYNYDHKGKRVR